MSDKSRERTSKHLRKAEKHYHQIEVLDDLFSRAIEVYIFLNASRLLLPEGKNWSTNDGNDGSPLNEQEYQEMESIYLSAMYKMLETSPSRSMKLNFVELVASLASLIGHQFATVAIQTIADFSLKELARKRRHLASTA